MEERPISILRYLFASAAERGTHCLDRPWPLHRAVSRLADSTLGDGLRLEPNEHVGTGVAGLDAAVLAMLCEGVLVPSEVDGRTLVPRPRPSARRSLFRLEAVAAKAIYDAAAEWVTLSEISEKNWRTPRSSVTVAVPPASPRQGRVAVRH
jgi:hypothetical protein